MTLSLDPPAINASGVLTFGYCSTYSVLVNVTCEVEGSCVSGAGVLPQVVIGMSIFFLSNSAMWGITVFSDDLTFLKFALPLNDTTSGLAIFCKSENCYSPKITLQSGMHVYTIIIMHTLFKFLISKSVLGILHNNRCCILGM